MTGLEHDARAMPVDQFQRARQYVDTSFGRIAYVAAGTGPVALFLHGWPLSGYQWRYQLGSLADLRRVIAVDSLGLGHTEMAPGQPLGMANQAGMAAAFLDALGIDAVDLVGNDSGGGAVQVLAAHHPERIRTLTLTNCEVHDYDEDNPASVRLRKAVESGALAKLLAQGGTDPAAARRAIAVAYEHPERLPDEVIRAYFESMSGNAERVAQAIGYLRATTNKETIAIADQLRALHRPVQVLWGTADTFFPLTWAHWLRDNLPQVEVSEVEGGRVFWPEEHPAVLNRALRAFWTRHQP
jgi:pimeloyl-ACP methyl ester carboxylesterase